MFRIVDQMAAANLETSEGLWMTKEANCTRLWDQSDILRKERQGTHTLIESTDKEDIIRTLRLVNDSYAHSTDNFYNLLDLELSSETDGADSCG